MSDLVQRLKDYCDKDTIESKEFFRDVAERIAELEERQSKVLSMLEGCNLTYSRLSTVIRIEQCIHTLSPQTGDENE
tara:strand:- start:17095 stop:17325 length:231 start_codon:yes stop_codon:yes gene_type:complete